MYSDFYGLVHGREYFTAEVIGHHVNFSAEMAELDFRKHVQGNRLFDGDLRLEGSMVLENAYPIYSEGSSDAQAVRSAPSRPLESNLSIVRAVSIQPTARVSTIDAESALKDRGE